MIDRLQAELAVRLGDQLLSPAWRKAYQRVPRHKFIPDVGWYSPPDGDDQVPVDRQADFDKWVRAAYAEGIFVTAMAANGCTPMSSCSMPYMVFTMLKALDLGPGMSVLDIGTATGWTAGLAEAYMDASGAVTSVEIDGELSNTARRNLRQIGLDRVKLVVGDGTRGYELGAPYDRIHAGCAVNVIPPAWLEQTKLGGVIVCPWKSAMRTGAVVKLVVDSEGSAAGHFVKWSAFMWLRAQAFNPPDQPGDFESAAMRSALALDSLDLGEPSAMFAAGLLVPDCLFFTEDDEDGNHVRLWLHGMDSWASLDGAGTVLQLGNRQLWDEVAAAHMAWREWGRPDFTRFGLTAGPGYQQYWLDEPSRMIHALATS